MDPRTSIQYLTGRLQKLRNFILLGHAANGALLILTGLAVVLVLGFIFNAAFFLTTTFRIIFAVTALLALAALFFRTVVWPIITKPSTETVALQVEEKVSPTTGSPDCLASVGAQSVAQPRRLLDRHDSGHHPAVAGNVPGHRLQEVRRPRLSQAQSPLLQRRRSDCRHARIRLPFGL